MKKIYKCLILPLLASTGLMASCNAALPTREELIAEGIAITDTFNSTTNTTWSSTIEGHFLDIWYSSSDPVSYTGELGYIGGTGNKWLSSMFKIPTRINSEMFADTYTGNTNSLRNSLAPTTSVRTNELDIEKTETGGILFQVVNENMEIYIYGLRNNYLDSSRSACVCKARWTVQVEYDNTGCLVSEKAWINATNDKSDAKTADLTATYTLS